jgi:hypothetical protein
VIEPIVVVQELDGSYCADTGCCNAFPFFDNIADAQAWAQTHPGNCAGFRGDTNNGTGIQAAPSKRR